MKNNFKKILSICLIFTMIFVMFGCKKSVSNDTSKKTFTVGFDAEYPPFGYITEDGSYTGFDLEVAEEVCKMEGWELVKKPIDWDSKDLELNSGNIDCIWNGFTITGREDDYTWTIPYCDNSIVFVVKNGSGISKKEDLASKIITTQAGSSAFTALTEEENADFVKTFASLETTPDFNSAFMNLESGISDCVVVDIGVAKYQLKNKSDKFVMLSEPFTSERYGVGFKKGNTELKDIVEKDILEIFKNGKFMEIAKKYSDYSLPDMICLE